MLMVDLPNSNQYILRIRKDKFLWLDELDLTLKNWCFLCFAGVSVFTIQSSIVMKKIIAKAWVLHVYLGNKNASKWSFRDYVKICKILEQKKFPFL